LHTLL
jgi:hypothetical protein